MNLALAHDTFIAAYKAEFGKLPPINEESQDQWWAALDLVFKQFSLKDDIYKFVADMGMRNDSSYAPKLNSWRLLVRDIKKQPELKKDVVKEMIAAGDIKPGGQCMKHGVFSYNLEYLLPAEGDPKDGAWYCRRCKWEREHKSDMPQV